MENECAYHIAGTCTAGDSEMGDYPCGLLCSMGYCPLDNGMDEFMDYSDDDEEYGED